VVRGKFRKGAFFFCSKKELFPLCYLKPYKVPKPPKISEKIKNIENVKSRKEVPKIGPNRLFEQFASVFPPYKAKKKELNDAI
jgi:hypothetical protein